MTTFVLAPDSFKESLTALQVCQIMEQAILKEIPNAQCILAPMADGGEGTVDALISACHGVKVACEVSGPIPHQKIQTYFGLIDDGKTAVIEMAKANGIELLEASKRNPLITSTFGTGEMILKALDLGVGKIILGLGGSVTNDAGAGMAQALGAQFFDVHGRPVEFGGGVLGLIEKMDLSKFDTRLKDVEVLIASDVNNPLCGETGASKVFAPQKGATAEMVDVLDRHLSHFADLVEAQLRIHVKHQAGAGAAGGLGFGLMAFAHAKMQSGATLIIEQVELAEKIKHADYVFTGEGSIDFQTKFGKTPWAVAQVAKCFNKPVIAFSGRVGDDIETLYDQGFSEIVGITPPDCDLETALKHAQENLAEKVQEVCQRLSYLKETIS